MLICKRTKRTLIIKIALYRTLKDALTLNKMSCPVSVSSRDVLLMFSRIIFIVLGRLGLERLFRCDSPEIWPETAVLTGGG